MEEIVLEFLKKYNLINKTLAVGFSGGHDSMCLLEILHKLSFKYELKLIAGHFNHNWRGEEALLEQKKCRQFCLDRNIEFYTETAEPSNKKSELVARELRYEFFERLIEKYNANAVLTAHNKNDNAETVLYRILKGTGIEGLKAIQEKRNFYYRPLLNVTREEIDEYCHENNLIPNEDSSNIDIKYKRNYIRNVLIPKAQEINTSVINALNTLSQVATDELNIIEEYLNKIKQEIYEEDKIITSKFVNLSNSIKRKLIYEVMVKDQIDYDNTRINAVYNFIEDNCTSINNKKFSLTKNKWISVNRNYIEIIVKQEKIFEELKILNCGKYKFGNYIFEIISCDEFVKNFPIDSKMEAYVDFKSQNIDFTLRTRRDGDIINPLGMVGTMKLKKYLISKKIPQHNRDNLILLCKENEVLWVAGFGLSNKIYVEDKPTHKIILRKIDKD